MNGIFSSLSPRTWLLLCAAFLLLNPTLDAQGKRKKKKNKAKISMEEIRQQCAGKPYEDRVRVSVARFNSTAFAAQREFGDELATMLTNALQQTSCFRVLETLNNMDDLTGEIAMNSSGMTNGSGPSGGQMLGAQVVVTGEITEFQDGKNNVSALGLSVGSDKARIGFVLKVVNPQTREVLFSRSINVLGKKGGFTGVRALGFQFAGSNNQNQAVADAAEQGILEATSILVENIDNMPLPGKTPGSARRATPSHTVNGGIGGSTFDPSTCTAVRSGNAPSVMVIIPEVHIQRAVPYPAGETEIIRQFVEAGFQVLDPAVYNDIRNSRDVQAATKNAAIAQELGQAFGADVVIIGEAFSERAGDQGGMISCRARVEARAVQTSNARILAANGLHAGGVDITESGSSKVALRNAGSLMANYFLEKMCDASFGGAAGSGSVVNTNGGATTTIEITDIDFTAVRNLESALEGNSAVSEVRTDYRDGNANLRVNHRGEANDLLDIILRSSNNAAEVTGFKSNNISLRWR